MNQKLMLERFKIGLHFCKLCGENKFDFIDTPEGDFIKVICKSCGHSLIFKRMLDSGCISTHL